MKTLSLALVAGAVLGAATLLVPLAPTLDPFGSMAAERIAAKHLEARGAAALQRLRVRQEIQPDLIAGRMSLHEAIAQTRPLYPQGLESPTPGSSLDERLGLILICWVAVDLPDEQRLERIERLLAELRDLLGHEPARWQALFEATQPAFTPPG